MNKQNQREIIKAWVNSRPKDGGKRVVGTGIFLESIGTKYVHLSSIWNDGTGKCVGNYRQSYSDFIQSHNLI